MKIGVIGFGHFAGIVALCLDQKGHTIIQSDEQPYLVRADQRQAAEELGYVDGLLKANIQQFAAFTCLTTCELLWIAYDVPLDERGAPVIDEILMRIQRLDTALPKTIPFLVSCQWPVGTTRKIAALCDGREFVYVLENVRAGKAIADFQAQPFPLIGQIAPLSRPVCDLVGSLHQNPALMLWESAEMAKHTLNAFMALQIAFINEIARICEAVGANPDDVSRALLSDPRVSPQAYLKPGPPFGGGSLKRDLLVLQQLRYDHALTLPILDAILESNGE